MKKVLLALHPFTDEKAQTVADDIRNRGDIYYTDASGSTVNVTVGDVTVEDVPEQVGQ